MTQTLYGVLAIGLLMLVMLSLQQGVVGSTTSQTFSELATPVQGVATDAFEHIDRQYFDRYVAKHVADAVDDASKTCGRVEDPAVFSAVVDGAFYDSEDGANAQCSAGASPGDRFRNCFYLEGFHGLATPDDPIEVERDGYTYRIEDITVRYVDENTSAPSATPTFAKEVDLAITHESIRGADGEPLQMRFQRVFQYDQVTNAILFPYYGKGFACPSIPPYPVRLGM